MTFPYMLLFSSSLIFSTLMLVTTSSWLLTWAALELNLLSFVPLISTSSLFQETESSIKYFLAQAVGSGVFISSMFVLSSTIQFSPSQMNVILMLFFMSMIIKMGAAPAHFWFPSVMIGLSWPLIMILTTWQKIAPVMILSSSITTYTLMPALIAGAMSSLIGGLGGLNQTQLRSLLAYSSIGHMGWILAGLSLSQSLMISYFTFYIILSLPILYFNWKMNLNSTQMASALMPTPLLLTIIMLFMSLAGLPPLMGFFPKWMIIYFLAPLENWIPLICLIMGSLINIFYYLMIILSTFYSLSFSQFTKSTPMAPTHMIVLMLTALAMFFSPNLVITAV